MTAVCGGGTSSIIDPSQEFLNLTGAAIADILFAGGVGWFAAAAAGLGYVAYDLLGLCGSDPPPLPVVDAPRFASYALSTQGAANLREDATAIIANILWRTYCKCDNNQTPPPLTPPPAPPGVQTNPPGLDTFPTTGSCADFTFFDTIAIAANGTFTDTPVPNIATTTSPLWATFIHNSGIIGFTDGYPLTINLEFRPSVGGAIIGRQTVIETESRPSANPFRDKFEIPTGTHYVTMSGQTAVQKAGSLQNNMFLHMFCTAAPPSAREDCCPPDPELVNLIIQVLKNEELILSLLGGSKKYKRGLVHAGLTGEGTIAVTNPFGIQLEITSGAPTSPLLPGVPPYQWSVGWASMITPDGMIDETRITRQLQVWASQLAPFATLVGYHVNPGFTIAITELDPA